VKIKVKIDAQTFRRFALFNAMRLKKQWRAPALFAALMSSFAAIAYSRVGVTQGAVMLGTVLLCVGLGLSAAYFLSFFLALKREIKKHGIETPRPAYTVTLSENIHVTAQSGDEATYEWSHIFGVYRGRGCTYLYITPNRAYLLPDRDIADGTDAVLRLAEKHGKLKNP
jgi:hypothetical protein